MIQQSVGVALALLVGMAAAATRADTHLEPATSPLRQPAAPTAGAELIVGYDACCTAQERKRLEQACGVVRCRNGYRSAYNVISLAPGRSAQQELQRLRRDRRVRFAELNGRVSALMAATDPYFSPYQWNLADTGFGIRVPSAWDRSTGAGVIVAVVDTGIAYENWGGFLLTPDLTMTSFVPGWDFISNDSHANDDHGHGTHVAGIIAANSNNGYGCAGVAPEAKLMPVKVLGPSGSGPTSALADGIRYAADHGAQVINVSLGTAQASEALREAVEYALGKGVVIVAAAGNDGSTKPVYPAAYPGVISVGATRYDGQRAFYSNHGPSLSLVAPGGDPKVDQNNDGFTDGILQQAFARDGRGQFGFYFKVGTSQAAPHVSGVAALLLSAQPELKPEQVQEAMEKTATDLGPPGRDDQYGWGLVNAAAAVNYVPLASATLGTSLPEDRSDNAQYNFEGGGFQGWNTTDNNRASVFNSSQYAYRGTRSLQVALKGVSDYTPGILRVELTGGPSIPVGQVVTASIQASSAGAAARIVLYDGRGQPVVGPYVTLSPGKWTPVSVTVPASASGPFRWIYLHFRSTGPLFTGNCYVDSIGW